MVPNEIKSKLGEGIIIPFTYAWTCNWEKCVEVLYILAESGGVEYICDETIVKLIHFYDIKPMQSYILMLIVFGELQSAIRTIELILDEQKIIPEDESINIINQYETMKKNFEDCFNEFKLIEPLIEYIRNGLKQ